MSLNINPLLIDKPVSAVIPARNYARQNESAQSADFAQQLAAVQTSNSVSPAAAGASTSGTTKSTASATAAAAATSSEEAAASEESDETTLDDIEIASSWRVDRSASEFGDEDEHFGFDDFVDIINPLQHIPVVGFIYRQMTGDEIKPVSRIVGDVAYGALTGSLLISGVISIASAAVEQQTGEAPEYMIANALFDLDKGKSTENTGEVMLASADEVEADAATDSATTSPVTPQQPTSSPSPVVAPSPVRVASATTTEDERAVSTSGAVATKQPFGGVMDIASTGRLSGNPVLAASAGKAPVTRIGSTIYTSPIFSNAARVPVTKTTTAAAAEATPTETAPAVALTAEESFSSSMAAETEAPMSVATTNAGASDAKSLGQTMHEAAKSREAGNSLPPELVRDMMIMALDKYKTAGNLAPVTTEAKTVN
ncbi:MAG: hypothetical protein HGA90_00730 [Alphaproteobacteria bacterium]|nr:hypothetical protein [Alphaproteobacteria bacterium]